MSRLVSHLATAFAVAATFTSSTASAATRAWQPGATSSREAQYRISGGQFHTCTVLYDGTVRCWGRNDHGQLGDGTLTNSATPRIVSIRVAGQTRVLTGITAVAAGGSFNCALNAGAGEVYCWGENNTGQLGIGTNTDSSFARKIPSITNAVRITAGLSHACALLASGSVQCWGSNGSGELAIVPNGGQRTSPVAVNGISGAIDLAAGASHTCVLVSGGTASCWGGGFGNGPTAVGSLANAFFLAGGSIFACAIAPGGVTKCWGRNTSGQLGIGNNLDQPAPVNATPVTNTAAIDGGSFHTCALAASGTVKCWGQNTAGQLGDNSTLNRNSPPAQPIAGLTLAVAVTGGVTHSCALKADGAIACWGSNQFGQVGPGVATGSNSPVPVNVGFVGSVNAKAVSTGNGHTCAVRSNGTVSCWGGGSQGQLGNGVTGDVLVPTAVGGLTGVTAVAAGSSHTCALIADGTVKCWGDNGRGQIGNGTNTPQPAPLTVTGLTEIVAIQAGSLYNCALTVGGTVFCWGANESGQLAISGDTQDRRAPNLVSGINGVTGLAAGTEHTCVARADGTVACWGAGESGQMGNGTSAGTNTVPISNPTLAGVVSIHAGAQHNCALDAGGVTRCWGRNDRGQLGINTNGNDQTVPAAVTGLATGIQASGADLSTCALNADGTISCFGANGSGQLGLGTADNTSHPTPTLVPGLGSMTAVSGGMLNRFFCAVRSNGALLCWGNNFSGQLGDGSKTNRPSPTVVPSFTVNIVPTVLLTSANPRKLTVNIVATCEEGDQLKLRVQVRQPNGAAGHGNETTRCTGTLATFPVEIQAQGGTPFAPGAATVEAEAEIRGEERTTQSWTRAVNIVAAQ